MHFIKLKPSSFFDNWLAKKTICKLFRFQSVMIEPEKKFKVLLIKATKSQN